MKIDLDSYADAYLDEFAHAFDNRIIMDWYPRRIMERCAPTDSVLEMGIGHGRTTRIFGEYFENHMVIEGSSVIIERFRAKDGGGNTVITQCMFEDYESDAQFDVVIAGFILEHVPDPSAILRRIFDYLRDGGRCFVAVPNSRSLHRQIGCAAGLLPNLNALSAGDLELGHKRLFSVDELEAICIEGGFEVIATEGLFLKPLTTSQLSGLNLSAEIEMAFCEVGIALPDLCCAILTEIRKPARC